ncbi:MAG: hypothetical protein M0R28_17915 [Pigmentiphaga sp.]|nr:hypothetical protein [Pigmentiphaga sp.]
MLVDIGSVIDAHLMTYKVSGKHVMFLSRWWRVTEVFERDGKRMYKLVARPAVDRNGNPRPLICKACSSLKLRQGETGQWRCECGSIGVAP